MGGGSQDPDDRVVACPNVNSEDGGEAFKRCLGIKYHTKICTYASSLPTNPKAPPNSKT